MSKRINLNFSERVQLSNYKMCLTQTVEKKRRRKERVTEEKCENSFVALFTPASPDCDCEASNNNVIVFLALFASANDATKSGIISITPRDVHAHPIISESN